MTWVDRILQRWRLRQLRPYVEAGNRLLDVGAADGALFHMFPDLGDAVGIDPNMPEDIETNGATMIQGAFPKDLPGQEPFDVITMLAVIQQIPNNLHPAVAEGCRDNLKPGGLLIITSPSPMVDRILKILSSLRLINFVWMDDHFGLDPKQLPELFQSSGFALEKSKRFQLGLNNLFVFRKNSEQ